MYCGNKDDPAMKYWETTELANKLPFLDLESTLTLAKTHELTRKILQRSLDWNKLISRTCLQKGGFLLGNVVKPDVLYNGRLLEEKMEVVRLLVEILKLMKDQRANMLDLLDTICKRTPPEAIADGALDTVTLSCPNHPDSHQVYFGDFLLLEAVEGAFGTSEQKLEAISSGRIGLIEPYLPALTSRLARQQEKLTLLTFASAYVRSKNSAEAFKTLLEASSQVTAKKYYGRISVLGPIGGDGWRVLAEGMRLHPGLLLKYVFVTKDALDEASKEDMRVLWDALKTDGELEVGLLEEDDTVRRTGEIVSKEEGEDDWTRLTEIMEMNKEEWIVRFEAEAEEEEEGEDESESDEEEEEG